MNALQLLQNRVELLTPAFDMAADLDAWNKNKAIVLQNFDEIIFDYDEFEGGETLQTVFEREVIPMISSEMMDKILSSDLDLASFMFVSQTNSYPKWANKYFDFIVENPEEMRRFCSSVISKIYSHISTCRIDTFISLMKSNDFHIGRFGLYQVVINKNLTNKQAVEICETDNTYLNNFMDRLTNDQIINFSSDAPAWVIADMAKVVDMANNELVEWFRTHKNANVRCALAKNPNADRGLLTLLTVDAKKSVINAALKALNNG